MERLYTIRNQRPEVISGGDLHTIVRASMVMDRKDFLQQLNRIVEQRDPQGKAEAGDAKRIFLSGGVCSLPDIYTTIEAAGGVVVGDDLCTGSRGLSGQIERGDDPINAIAARYAQRAICPSKHAGITCRGDHLVSMAKAHAAQGVIFIFLKFCDPHAFDYPYLKSMLDAHGIPSLMVELEEQGGLQGQFRTRCEAFIEMI
jgi:benzoyl-CoA reductase/2-hydroxyglutaryl-CoA dehydratase subunit BcrC/BadD/HgdB